VISGIGRKGTFIATALRVISRIGGEGTFTAAALRVISRIGVEGTFTAEVIKSEREVKGQRDLSAFSRSK